MSLNSAIMQKDFWIEQWNELNKLTTAYSDYSSPATWNAMAPGYGKERYKTDVDDRIAKTIERLEKGGFVFKNSRILDVGCGNGRYARAFAHKEAEVVCVDVSEKMIERLQSESTTDELSVMRPLVADWKTMNIDRYGFTKGFDLVFANMTPAVADPDSFLKLMDASKKRCWFRGWVGKRTNPMLERLHHAITGNEPEPYTGNFNIAWNLIVSSGHFPDSMFETIHWTHRKPLDECVAFHTLFFSKDGGTGNGVRDKIESALSEIAVDGCIENTVTGHTGSMLWSVNHLH